MDGGVAARVPVFKSHLRAEVNEGEGAYLFSEHGVTALRGARIASLAALLDGNHDFGDLLRAQPGGMDADQVTNLIGQLVDAGLVSLRAPEDSEVDEQAQAYWDACGVAAADAARAAVATVALVGVNATTGLAQVEKALRETGVDVHSGPSAAADLTVVICEDYLDPGLAAVDAAQRAMGKPWLLAKPAGTRVWLGPFFEADQPGCWHCLSNRLWGHRHAEACVQASLGRQGPASRPVPSLPPLAAAAGHLIALEVTKWLAGHRYPGQRSVWTFDTQDFEGSRHELRARPQCANCGDAALFTSRACKPVQLNPARKASSSGGGHRTLMPAQVLDRYRHLVSPVTGIIKEIKQDPNVPAFINAYRSGVNVSRNVTGLNAFRANLRSENGGKGLTPLDAEVGALCEAIERFSGTFQGDEFRIRASFRALGELAMHPNDCLLFDERQYATRESWNPRRSPFNHVGEPFDEDEVTDWTPLWSITEGRHRMLPTAMLYFGAPPNRSLSADSNGNAAGSSLEDAILQGTLELVERDAVAIWWYNRLRLPEVDLDAFAEPWLTELREHYARLGREVWVLDATADLGTPVMVAVSRRVDRPGERIMLGFGAHLDPRTALRRALTELNQLLPGGLDDSFQPEDPDAAAWLGGATVANQPYLRPDETVPARGPADFGYVPREDVREDVDALAALLAERGLELLVLDQTRPDIGLPVVKVVIPGIRHFWARFAPGRLFDVPVRLGRLSAPTPYHQLNPMPLFL
ncbi:TOMM precursor leader peptide-binding protein [Amycolatopsis magusensis]|uniref:TOMM precursor leader peptide-binding protein n=1 Tax=Amycolatopsis magusensis TaxID=882444 RepID=UPI00379CFFE0